MICDGSSTKSQATFTPAKPRSSTLAQAMVQQMAELVKNGLDLAMGQQRWAILAGRSQVAANQAQMRILTVAARFTGDQSIHPGAAALVLARKPVRIKSAHQLVAAQAGFRRRFRST